MLAFFKYKPTPVDGKMLTTTFGNYDRSHKMGGSGENELFKEVEPFVSLGGTRPCLVRTKREFMEGVNRAETEHQILVGLNGTNIFLEGTIGAGKSSNREILPAKIMALNPEKNHVIVIPEPNMDKLKEFLDHPKEYGLTFQMNMIYERTALFKAALIEARKFQDAGKIVTIISDRASFEGDEVFAWVNYISGNITKLGYAAYLENATALFESLKSCSEQLFGNNQRRNIFFYLRASTDVSVVRLEDRCRTMNHTTGEESYDRGYLDNLVQAYDQIFPDVKGRPYYILNQKKHIIDGVLTATNSKEKRDVIIWNEFIDSLIKDMSNFEMVSV